MSKNILSVQECILNPKPEHVADFCDILQDYDVASQSIIQKLKADRCGIRGTPMTMEENKGKKIESTLGCMVGAKTTDAVIKTGHVISLLCSPANSS